MGPVRTTVLTSIMAPHRIPLFNALAADPALDLTVIYLARSDPRRAWATYEEEMHYRHVVLHEHFRVARDEVYFHVTSGLFRELRRARAQVLLVGGWDQIAYQEAWSLRRLLGVRLLW